MNKIYLQLEFSTGKIYEYSKEPKEGFVEFKSTKGNISYRRYHKSITGELASVSIRDTKVGQELSICLTDESNTMYFSLALLDQKSFVDNVYCEDIIGKLPRLEVGLTYTINPFRFLPEDSKFEKTGISVKQGDLKIERVFTNSYKTKEGEDVKGDIPAIVWKKDAIGKNRPSAASKEMRSDFFLEKLAEQTERLKWKPKGSATSYEKTTTAPPVVAVTHDVSDELPF